MAIMPPDPRVVDRKRFDELTASLRRGEMKPQDVLEGLSISEKAFVGCLSLDLFLISWKYGSRKEELSDGAVNEKFIELLTKHILEHGYFSDHPPRHIRMKQNETSDKRASQDGPIYRQKMNKETRTQ